MGAAEDIIDSLDTAGLDEALAAPLLAAVEAAGLDLTPSGGGSAVLPLELTDYEVRPVAGRPEWWLHAVTFGDCGTYQWVEQANGVLQEAVFVKPEASGGGSPTVVAISDGDSPYVVLPTDQTIICTPAGGPITVDLASQNPDAGRVLTIADFTGTAGTNPITIITTGSGFFIDGLETLDIGIPYGSVTLQGDGATGWIVTARWPVGGQITV